MSDEVPSIDEMRHIHDPLDVGATEDGQHILMNMRMEDESTEWFAVQHSKVGRLVSGIMFASSVAENNRHKTTALGNSLPELSNVMDIVGVNASANPGEDFICLRMVLGEGVNLDYRIPITAIQAIENKIQMAVAVAKSGKLSSH